METAMPKTPSSTIPGMTDSLEFVKNLWGSMNVPGMGMPGMTGAPLSTDDLDKKIADLKAVESWLNLNTTMLRGTIQALEVQRGTLATLKTMSANMAQAMEQGTEQAAQFAQFFAQSQAGRTASAGSQQKQQQGQSQQGGQGGASQGAAAASPAAAAMPAAVAWWNLLQEQFKQAVENAMSPEAMAGAAAIAQNAASLATGGALPAADAPKPEAQAKPQGDSGNASAQPGVQQPWPPKSGPAKS
jgi:hypothetical protein